MKILDGRLRPPYGAILKQKFFADKVFTRAFNKKFGMQYAESAERESMEILLQEMKSAGVVKGLTPLRRTVDDFQINEDFASLEDLYPGFFIGFAGLNPAIGMQETLDEIDKYVLNGKFTGINLEPGLPSPAFWHLDDEKYFPIYEKCEKADIPVYLTWGGLSQPPFLSDPQAIDNVARAFPKMRMFLGHAGFPRATEHCVLAMNHKNVYLGIDLYIINAPGQQDYITAANYRCKEKICFGSAYPYNDIIGAVKWYKNSAFREEVLEDIFYNNAAHFAGLID